MSSRAKKDTHSMSHASKGKKMELLKNLADKKINKFKHPTNTTKAKFKVNKEARIQDLKKKEVVSPSTIQTRAKRVLKQCSLKQTMRKNELRIELTPVELKVERGMPNNEKEESFVPASTNSVMDSPQEPTELENGIHAESPKLDSESKHLDLATEAKSDLSSECELNGNTEFFIISDSELNNYMDSDHEFSVPTSAFCSGDHVDNNPNSFLFVVNNSPNSKLKFNKIASDNAVNSTCIYRDPELKTLSDNSALAVITDQQKLLSALEYYLSKENKSSASSPKEKRALWENSLAALSEINPSDLILSSASEKILSDISLFPKDLECEASSTNTNSKSLTSDFSAFCDDKHCTQWLTEKRLPPLISDSMVTLSCDLDLGANTECSTSEGMPSNSESSKPSSQPQEKVTRSKNATSVKRKRKRLFNVRKKRRVRKQVVLHQNDLEEDDERFDQNSTEQNHRNSDLCNFTEDYSKVIQSVLEDNQDCTSIICLEKAQDDEMTGENFAVCNLNSDPVPSDAIDMSNVNSDNSVDMQFDETIAKVSSKEIDVQLDSDKKCVEPDKDTRTEESSSTLIIFTEYEDENLDYEPELEMQNEIESLQDGKDNLECSSDTEGFENIELDSKPKLVLNDQSVTKSLENLNANKHSDALNAQDSEECSVIDDNKPNDRLLSQPSDSKSSSKTDSQIHKKTNDRLMSRRNKNSSKTDSPICNKPNNRLMSKSSGGKSSSKTDSQITQSDKDSLDPEVNLTELDSSLGKVNCKHFDSLSNSDVPKQSTEKDQSHLTNKFVSLLEEGEMQEVVDGEETSVNLSRISSQIKLWTNKTKLPLKPISSRSSSCSPNLCSSDKVLEKESTPPLNSERTMSYKRPIPSEDDSDSDSERSFKRRRTLGKRNNEVCQQNEQVNGVHCNEKPSQKDSDELQNDMSGDVVDSFSSVSTNLSIDKSYDSPVEGFDFFNSDSPDFFDEHHFQDESHLTSSTKKAPAMEARDVKGVLHRIGKHCDLGQISIAICIAKRYISISTEDTQKEIFKMLFWNVTNYIMHPDCNMDSDLSAEMISSILDIFYDHKLQDPEMCSFLISRCFEESLFISHATDMFEFCQKQHILLNETAIAAYANFLMPQETCMSSLLSFLEYVKTVSEFFLPKKLLHEAITSFLNIAESQSLPYFKRFCDLLCVVNYWEVDEDYLQKFIECCIQNDCWFEIAKCFRAWSKKGPLSHALSQAFMCKVDSAGTYYAKFAAAVYDGVETLPLHLGHLFGQIGVMLMLEAYFADELQAALEILYTLHKYHINIHELQVPLYHGDCVESYFKVLPESTEVFVFSFTVAFAAIDICLQFARPKDAFEILQGFSKTIPASLIAPLKSEIVPQRFNYLLKLTQLLHSVDPANKGLEAFHSLLSAPELDEDAEVKSLVEDKMKDIEDIFNQYLISLMNEEKVQLALDLNTSCTRTFQESLNLRVPVLRGLITAAAQNGMTRKANDLFLRGCMKNIYQIEKPTLETFPWILRVGTSWTTAEMKLAIEYFIENLSRILVVQNKKMKFENWFSIKIVFRQDPKDSCLEINCLRESSPSIQAAMKRVGDALTIMDSNLSWDVNASGNILEINSQSFYNFWKQKFQDTAMNTGISKSFNVQGKVRVSFGKKLPESPPEAPPETPAIDKLIPPPQRPAIDKLTPPPQRPAIDKLTPPPQRPAIDKLTITKSLTEDTQYSEAVRSIRLEAPVPVHNDEEFQKIVLFLKSKVLLKCRHLTEQQQGQKADSLARTFILENNVTSKLNKRTMKLLSEFAEKSIDS